MKSRELCNSLWVMLRLCTLRAPCRASDVLCRYTSLSVAFAVIALGGWGELGHGFLGEVAAFGDLQFVVGLDQHGGRR